MNNDLPYLPMTEMIAGGVYLIKARNASVGIWNPDDNSFHIIRSKFGSSFLCSEYHWDTGAPFGTVKPLKHLSDYSGVDFYEHIESLGDGHYAHATEIIQAHWVGVNAVKGD